MEFIVAAAVIVLLCVCLGVNGAYIIAGGLILLEVILLLILLFFIRCAFLLAGSKRTDARFSHIDKAPNGGFDVAYYISDGEEYPNYLPAEMIFRNRFYIPDSSVKLRVCEKKKCAFDLNARITVYLGLILGTLSFIAVGGGLLSSGIIF